MGRRTESGEGARKTDESDNFPNVRTHERTKTGGAFAYQTGIRCLLFKDPASFCSS